MTNADNANAIDQARRQYEHIAELVAARRAAEDDDAREAAETAPMRRPSISAIKLERQMTYRIIARIAAADTYGYSIYDYFRGTEYDGDVLDREFDTADDAEAAAASSYKGADVEGVGCVWHIEEGE